MLTETQKQFIFKRSLFQRVSGYIAWSIGVSTAVAWGLMYWLKPEMVNPQAVLAILKAKKDSGVDVSQLTDIAVLAVTGASAISAVFILLVLLAFMISSWAKKEKRYLDIINHLEKRRD
jgi:predicted metal-binding membrane protein